MRSSSRTALVGLVLSLTTLVAVPTVLAVRGPTDLSVGQRPVAVGPTAPPSEPAHPRATSPREAPAAPTVRSRPAVAPRRALTDVPRRLVVAAVGLDVPVDAVGVAPDGTMAIPPDVNRAGWYRFGPAPGQAGSAVLVGHVDSRTQGLGAFARLAATDVGDRAVVTGASGTTYVYRVVARELLPKRTLPTKELWARFGASRLTLITCGGPYDRDRGGYQDNLVVTAVPVAAVTSRR